VRRGRLANVDDADAAAGLSLQQLSKYDVNDAISTCERVSGVTSH